MPCLFLSHLNRDGKPLPRDVVRRSRGSRGGVYAILVLGSGSSAVVVRGRWRKGTVLRPSFASSPSVFRILVVIADVGEVVRHAVDELGDGASDVLVKVRLQLSLEVQALLLSSLVLLVVVNPLQLSRCRLIKLWRGA